MSVQVVQERISADRFCAMLESKPPSTKKVSLGSVDLFISGDKNVEQIYIANDGEYLHLTVQPS